MGAPPLDQMLMCEFFDICVFGLWCKSLSTLLCLGKFSKATQSAKPVCFGNLSAMALDCLHSGWTLSCGFFSFAPLPARHSLRAHLARSELLPKCKKSLSWMTTRADQLFSTSSSTRMHLQNVEMTKKNKLRMSSQANSSCLSCQGWLHLRWNMDSIHSTVL